MLKSLLLRAAEPGDIGTGPLGGGTSQNQPKRTGLRRVRNSDGLPGHVIKIGHDRCGWFAILVSKSIDKNLKPKGHSGRFGTKHDAQPFPNLVADRAAVQTVDLQLARKVHCFPRSPLFAGIICLNFQETEFAFLCIFASGLTRD